VSEHDNTEGLTLKIKSCGDCPRFSSRHVRHWMVPGGGWEYRCTKARRTIYPEDGVNPPPKWCPLRLGGAP
jgi:hypothetical protein